MSTYNNILKAIGIEDLNINLSADFSVAEKKGIKYTILSGTLSYTPDYCPVCGHRNTNYQIIKNGSKVSNIKLLPLNGLPTFLKLKKQRFLCKECNHTFIAETNIVRKHCFLSNFIKKKILVDLQQKKSEKDIAFDNFVSHSTVSKAVDTAFSSYAPKLNYLPKHLMFDEFKSTKDAKGSMSFIFSDADNHEIIDILDTRTKTRLTSYFSKFSKAARNSVTTISMDMYSPYMDIAKELFPNANIVLDRFHLVQLISRAFNISRVQAMKNFSKHSIEYKRLKRYWKLLLKPANALDGINFKHFTHFQSWISQQTAVAAILSADECLKDTYRAFQILYSDIKNSDIVALKTHLYMLKDSNISIQMKTAIKSLMLNLQYIENTFKYNYSNGALEGTNNYIKTLKRIAFGYKSFFHFRNRILISRKLVSPKEMY